MNHGADNETLNNPFRQLAISHTAFHKDDIVRDKLLLSRRQIVEDNDLIADSLRARTT
jgi:hypothetical protein